MKIVLSSTLSILIILLQGFLATNVVAQSISDPLTVPMGLATKALEERTGWAAEIPKPINWRRMGKTLIVALGAPVKEGPSWKAWWQDAICFEPDLYAILKADADSSILIHEGFDSGNPHLPKNGREDDKALWLNRGECNRFLYHWDESGRYVKNPAAGRSNLKPYTAATNP